MYACVALPPARRSVWAHRKPIETPAGCHCQPLIKREKNALALRLTLPPGKGQSGLEDWFPHSTLFILYTCHFHSPANELNEMKHIKRQRHCDHFLLEKEGQLRAKTDGTKGLKYRQEIATGATDPQLQHQD